MFWFILIAIYIILDAYVFQVFKTLTRRRWIYWAYLFVSLAILANLIFQFSMPQTNGWNGQRGYAVGFFLAILSLKVILILFLIGEDILRVLMAGFMKLFGKSEKFQLPGRRKFVSQVALGLAVIPFSSLLYGMYKGRYNYQVFKYTLYFEDLPDSFDGYRISQISDIHCGSFSESSEVQYGLDLLNEQQSDAVVVTGDLVNNTAAEMRDWKEIFSGIKAKDGVYSVLGNHDYGDYHHWDSEEDKEANLAEIKQIQADMGWKVLLNEHQFIERGKQRLALVGVENWGEGFKQKGDLALASKGLDKKDFKILLSHDPSHWQAQVKKDPNFYHLTLSGHTHGMQFGIEIPGFIKWSPASFRYKNWAGIYQEFGRYINVNRGFGYIGYPGRVGIWPEISVIELRKGSKPA